MYPDQRISRLEFVSLANAPDIAALHARDVLRGWSWPGPLDIAWLVVAELVNCAVARPVPIPRMLNHPTLDAARPLQLTLHWAGPALSVQLWDSDPTPSEILATHPERHGARGLALVAGYCSRWSYHFPPEGGKVLWCELPARPALPNPGPSRELESGAWGGPRQPMALPAAPPADPGYNGGGYNGGGYNGGGYNGGGYNGGGYNGGGYNGGGYNGGGYNGGGYNNGYANGSANGSAHGGSHNGYNGYDSAGNGTNGYPQEYAAEPEYREPVPGYPGR